MNAAVSIGISSVSVHISPSGGVGISARPTAVLLPMTKLSVYS
jgi:hypothetical protein